MGQIARDTTALFTAWLFDYHPRSSRVVPMKAAATQQSQTRYPLIGPDDPPPFEIVNPGGKAPVLFVCDHASRAFPRHMGCLGLDKSVLDRHIAWDIGSAGVARQLCERFDAVAVFAGYSRLLVDCNRQLYDPSAFIKVSDGIAIPGNLNLSEDEKWLRVQSFYWPYHNAVSEQIHQLRASGVTPAVLSIHSCTPVYDRVIRPWHIGVLWDQDPRIATPLIRQLGKVDGLCVGDNEPYSGRHPHDFTIDFHAEPTGLPHVGIEVRQDLVESPEGIRQWAGLLGDGLEPILGDTDLYQRFA